MYFMRVVCGVPERLDHDTQSIGRSFVNIHNHPFEQHLNCSPMWEVISACDDMSIREDRASGVGDDKFVRYVCRASLSQLIEIKQFDQIALFHGPLLQYISAWPPLHNAAIRTLCWALSTCIHLQNTQYLSKLTMFTLPYKDFRLITLPLLKIIYQTHPS